MVQGAEEFANKDEAQGMCIEALNTLLSFTIVSKASWVIRRVLALGN
jgi:hypothetical protein